jgi:hypothetical protein
MDPLFEVHLLNEAGINKATELALAFNDLITRLHAVCPESREFSICKTNLETASFYAKKAIAMLPENQKS